MRRWLWRFTIPSTGSRVPTMSLSRVDLPALKERGGYDKEKEGGEEGCQLPCSYHSA
jgi:hypothetical protein